MRSVRTMSELRGISFLSSPRSSRWLYLFRRSFPACVIRSCGSAWERPSQGRRSSFNDGGSPDVFDELQPSKPDAIFFFFFLRLIIKACSSIRCRFCFVYLFICFLLLFSPPRVVPVVSAHLFSGQVESVLLSFLFLLFFSPLFCSFWHPTKLIASEGIGVEGPVLFWQFFQERPSIRWSIVLERDLSLLNSWLAARSRCCKGIKSLPGTL